jgi:hypothetical protein
MKNEKGPFGKSPKATAKIKMQKSKIKMQNDNVKCKKKSLEFVIWNLEFVIWNLFVIWCLGLSRFAAACSAEGIFTFHLLLSIFYFSLTF